MLTKEEICFSPVAGILLVESALGSAIARQFRGEFQSRCRDFISWKSSRRFIRSSKEQMFQSRCRDFISWKTQVGVSATWQIDRFSPVAGILLVER